VAHVRPRLGGIHPAAAPSCRVHGRGRGAHYGFWSANANRLVYAIDEDDGAEARVRLRVRHAAGARGDRRGAVPRDLGRRDDAVWYDLFAFSRRAIRWRGSAIR
jgi:uncharacterized protein (UPF0548 family)